MTREQKFNTHLCQSLERDLETLLELWEYDGVITTIERDLVKHYNKTRRVWKKLLNKKSGKGGKMVWNRVAVMADSIEQNFDVRNERMFDIFQIIYNLTNLQTFGVFATLDEIINNIEKTVFEYWDVRFHDVEGRKTT